ncbi:MAG: hypothetical protein H6510_14590 [Acidobacteria bacterium]|nr:hypothetical protein [Acidobacteriota bacterium]
MSVAAFIVAERDIDGFDSFVNGKSVILYQNQIDQACRILNVTPLFAFLSSPPGEWAEFFEEDQVPAEKWYPPNEGLKTVRALRRYIQEQKGVLEPILSDLEEYDNVLTRLEQEQVRWHLQIDY